MTPPVNPEPVPPPFSIVEAVKGQPAPDNENWNHVHEMLDAFETYKFGQLNIRNQLAVLLSDAGSMRTIILTWDDAQLFHAIMSRALAKWNEVNAADPVQATLADVFNEVVSRHQDIPF